MRDYIKGFFREFEYGKEDSDELLRAYDRITEHPQASLLLDECLAAYEGDVPTDFSAMISAADRMAAYVSIHEYTAGLILFICFSGHLEKLYSIRGIDRGIYKNSMLDLKYKLNECRAVYGIAGSFVCSWFGRFFDLTRFALGRLQFEVIEFGEHYEKNGMILTPETKVLNIHIPRSGERLTEEACFNSYLMAKDFFKNEINRDPCPFVCSSYLLFPSNERFLEKGTNLYRFLKSFDVFRSRPDKGRDNLWRIFDTMEKNPDRLPRDTSLRRALADYLKNGGEMGSGRGVFFM